MIFGYGDLGSREAADNYALAFRTFDGSTLSERVRIRGDVAWTSSTDGRPSDLVLAFAPRGYRVGRCGAPAES